MSFLDKPLGDLSLADLQRLISSEVSSQVPAIPSGVLALSNLAEPLTMPANPGDGQVITYSGSLGGIQLGTVQADFVTTGTLNVGAGGVTIQSSPTGQRIVLDNQGIHLFDSGGNPVVDLPTDSSKTAYFAGTVTASSFIGTNTQLNTTQLQSGGTLGLQAGVSSPLSPPGATIGQNGLLVIGTRYYISFSWYDGTHETAIGPNASVLPYQPSGGHTILSPYKEAQVVLPPAPTGVTQARVYMGTSPFTPGSGNGHLQTTVAVSTSANTTLTLASFNNAGATPPAANNFPSGTTSYAFPAGQMDSNGNDYGWRIEGNGRLRFLGPTVQDQFWIYDEFVYLGAEYPAASGTIFGGPVRWSFNATGTASAVGPGSSVAQEPGVVQLGTGTTTTGIATIRTGAVFSTGSARLRGSFKIMVDTVPGATNSFGFSVGLTSQGAAGGNGQLTAAFNGICIENTSQVAAGFLQLSVSDGATLVQQAGSVAIAAGTWYFCEFEVDAGRSKVNWWINGVAQTAITTHIPAVATVMGMMATVQKSAGTVSRTLNLDNVSLYGDYVSG